MFFDTDFLKDEEIYLKLIKTTPADPIKDFAPAYHFKICLLDNTEVGECDFRVGHGEKLYYGGHIGYGVLEKFRGHHYAGKACKLLFRLAKKHGFEELIITCNPDNFASRKTCDYAGATFHGIVKVPTYSDMYKEGEREKCIYKYKL